MGAGDRYILPEVRTLAYAAWYCKFYYSCTSEEDRSYDNRRYTGVVAALKSIEKAFGNVPTEQVETYIAHEVDDRTGFRSKHPKTVREAMYYASPSSVTLWAHTFIREKRSAAECR